jgi:asparagine synthase (glutamine-hydrolysing)
MFLCGFLGNEAELSPWGGAVQEHARWLGLEAHIESRCLADKRTLAVARLARRTRGMVGFLEQAGQRLTLTTGEPTGSASVVVSLPAGELTVAVPLASPEPFHYAQTAHGYLFGNDLRFFPRLVDVELDECALYALFHFGAVPPPLTIWRGIRRLPSGHRSSFVSDSPEPVSVPFLPPAYLNEATDGRVDAETRVREALDAVLADLPTEAVLYFSGGVDSGLIAARLIRAGRRDVRLLNYSFGEHDEESLLARRMASHLGLSFEEVRHDPLGVGDVLGRLGRDYSFPFEDLSTVPTNLLVHASLSSIGASDTVVEGTGADGAFGLTDTYPRWRRVYAVPEFVRRRVAHGYAGLRLWRRRWQLERLGRFVRKSAQMPLGYAVVAQNALDDIAYTVAPQARAAVLRAVRTNVEALSGGARTLEQLRVMDLIWVCAGRMASKSFDPLRRHGISPVYPFLAPAVLGVSASLSSKENGRPEEAKAILKRLLAEAVPREWVYRPKSGFTPPYREIFTGPAMQACLHDVVLDPSNPLLAFCRPGTVHELVDGTRSQRGLSSGAYEFLWALTFASNWLRQQPNGGRRPPNLVGQ